MNPAATDTDAPPARRYLSWARSALAWGLLALFAWLVWPSLLGGSTSLVVVSGDSMLPTYESGDLVIARKGEPQIGDVIIYSPEGYGRSQIVHRVIGGDSSAWDVQGDNNDLADPFTPSNDEVVGVVKIHIPDVGKLTGFLLNPLFWAFLILVALVLLLWFGGDECDGDEDDGADPTLDGEPVDGTGPLDKGVST